jgi:hypothetical protein
VDENGWALVALAEGETLFGLALRYDTTAEALKRANAMLDNNLDLRDGAPPRPPAPPPPCRGAPPPPPPPSPR